jgi:hypothetical protein
LKDVEAIRGRKQPQWKACAEVHQNAVEQIKVDVKDFMLNLLVLGKKKD